MDRGSDRSVPLGAAGTRACLKEVAVWREDGDGAVIARHGGCCVLPGAILDAAGAVPGRLKTRRQSPASAGVPCCAAGLLAVSIDRCRWLGACTSPGLPMGRCAGDNARRSSFLWSRALTRHFATITDRDRRALCSWRSLRSPEPRSAVSCGACRALCHTSAGRWAVFTVFEPTRCQQGRPHPLCRPLQRVALPQLALLPVRVPACL